MNLQDHADKVKDVPAKEEKLSKTKPAAVVEMQSSDEEDEPPQKQKKQVGLIVLFLSANSVCEFAGSCQGSQR